MMGTIETGTHLTKQKRNILNSYILLVVADELTTAHYYIILHSDIFSTIGEWAFGDDDNYNNEDDNRETKNNIDPTADYQFISTDRDDGSANPQLHPRTILYALCLVHIRLFLFILCGYT